MKKLGVIGYPLAHTLSPAIHSSAIAKLGLDLTYSAIETSPEQLGTFMDRLREPDWLGVNVTVPHKQAVISHIQELADDARLIGAVNTIVNDAGRLEGYNTDAAGFVADLEDKLGKVDGKRVAVLGAGGAARAVCFALKDRAENVWVLNRTAAKGERLAFAFGLEVGRREDLRHCQLMVNCTSAGLHGDEAPIPDDWAPEGIDLYDLIYNPPVTRLMRAVQERGGRAVNGLGMLVRQAAVAFRIWTGQEPPLKTMFEAVHA
jgi:shikimate dehydrogenase